MCKPYHNWYYPTKVLIHIAQNTQRTKLYVTHKKYVGMFNVPFFRYNFIIQNHGNSTQYPTHSHSATADTYCWYFFFSYYFFLLSVLTSVLFVYCSWFVFCCFRRTLSTSFTMNECPCHFYDNQKSTPKTASQLRQMSQLDRSNTDFVRDSKQILTTTAVSAPLW